ncbi:hypothetical protein V1517DRAFT_237600, partial [Lipomyces orientalis]
LQKRNFAIFGGAFGTVFFGLPAYGARGVVIEVCKPAAVAAIATLTSGLGAASCAGAFAVAALCGAISAGLAANAGYDGWHWWKGSGTAGKRHEVSMMMPIMGNTLCGGIAHTAQVHDHIKVHHPHIYGTLTRLGVFDDNRSGTVNFTSDYKYYTWSSDARGYMTTTVARHTSLNESLHYFQQELAGVNKRDLGAPSGEWLSFNTYGLNVDTAHYVTDCELQNAEDVYQGYDNILMGKLRPCTNSYECYYINDKMCMSAGRSFTPGVASEIV